MKFCSLHSSTLAFVFVVFWTAVHLFTVDVIGKSNFVQITSIDCIFYLSCRHFSKTSSILFIADPTSIVQIGSNIHGKAKGDYFGSAVSMSSDGTTFVVGARAHNNKGYFDGQASVYKFNPKIQSYEQLGMDINGAAPHDQFGISVAMSADGKTFVVGAPFHAAIGNYDNTGHVLVYRFDENTNEFAQFGPDIIGEAPNDSFGWSVSMSADGTTFIVGAPNNGGKGHVRVYKFNEKVNEYTQLGSDIDGESVYGSFGSAVSISANGKMFVVGATCDRNYFSCSCSAGHVRVYKFNEANNMYMPLGSEIAGEAEYDNFGYSVSISASGKTFVVGAPMNEGAVNFNSGHIRVYQFNEINNDYVQLGSDINAEGAGDRFGNAVSMSANGKTIIVGAPENDANAINSDKGHVRVYQFNETAHQYEQLGSDINGDNAYDSFGSSVSISADGSTVMVGAPYNDANINDVYANFGRVRVFAIPIAPTKQPTSLPTHNPSSVPTTGPSSMPTASPSLTPSEVPTTSPSSLPSILPTTGPSTMPSTHPSSTPSTLPSANPSSVPSSRPTNNPSSVPTTGPSSMPTASPSHAPSMVPSMVPSALPSKVPTKSPSKTPTNVPTIAPTSAPSISPIKVLAIRVRRSYFGFYCTCFW